MRQGATNKMFLSMWDYTGQMNTEKNVDLDSLSYKMLLLVSLGRFPVYPTSSFG